MSEPIITFNKVNKWYGNNFHVLRDIDLTVTKGERIVVCGPSGSGKSTMIRCINRLEEHQQGNLIVDGVELSLVMARSGSPSRLKSALAIQKAASPAANTLRVLKLPSPLPRKIETLSPVIEVAARSR